MNKRSDEGKQGIAWQAAAIKWNEQKRLLPCVTSYSFGYTCGGQVANPPCFIFLATNKPPFLALFPFFIPLHSILIHHHLFSSLTLYRS